MSLNVPALSSNVDVDLPDASEKASQEGSPQEDPEESQVLLFSQSDSIGDFSEGDPAPSSSPSISSFSSSSCSESILKNLPIVFSDPKVVEQIVVVDSGSSNNSSLNSSCENNTDNGNNCSSMEDILSADPVVNVMNPPSKSPKIPKVSPKVSSGPKASGGPKSTGKGRGQKGPKGVSTVSSDSESEFRRPLPVSGGAVPQSPVRGSNRSRSPLSPAGSHKLPPVVGSKPGRSTSR